MEKGSFGIIKGISGGADFYDVYLRAYAAARVRERSRSRGALSGDNESWNMIYYRSPLSRGRKDPPRRKFARQPGESNGSNAAAAAAAVSCTRILDWTPRLETRA